LCDHKLPKTYMSPDTPFSALNNENSLQLQSRVDQVVKSGAMLECIGSCTTGIPVS